MGHQVSVDLGSLGISEQPTLGATQEPRRVLQRAQDSLRELAGNPNLAFTEPSPGEDQRGRDWLVVSSGDGPSGSDPEFARGYSQCRIRPPWNEPGPDLHVGFDNKNQEFIIRARGGHIIGATSDLREVGRLIRHESHYGYGSVELLLSGRHPDDTWTYHGHGSAKPVSVRKPKPSGKLSLSLDDLGLGGPRQAITLDDLDIDL